MGYKNIKPKLIQIKSLARKCGLFTSDTELNNGYGCKSKSKRKEYPGYCCPGDCPLAHTTDRADMKKYDKRLYEEYKEESDATANESGWLIQFRINGGK